MIVVENLSKRFGATHAVQDISFQVQKGEILGFLGPNGAGKTTTMRILAGSLGATAGTATIGGLDVAQHPRQVKRRLGYLPEAPPLYRDMTVGGYVRFAARIKGVQEVEAATEKVMERVGLTEMRQRLVGHLSKGFQQRAGLAQALVHEPEVLVLDEPTSGLDPAQRKEIRDLIRNLAAGERTVILSTHVLPEVDDLCERVIIIDRGRIAAKDSIEKLAQAQRLVRLQVGRPSDALLRALEQVPGVSAAEQLAEGSYALRTNRDARADIARAAAPYDLLELAGRERLEDIYLRLTGSQGAAAAQDGAQPGEAE